MDFFFLILKELEEITGKLKTWGGKGLSVIPNSKVIRQNNDKSHDIKNKTQQNNNKKTLYMTKSIIKTNNKLGENI